MREQLDAIDNPLDQGHLCIVPSLRLVARTHGLQVINSVDPCVLKSNYYIGYYVIFSDPESSDLGLK